MIIKLDIDGVLRDMETPMVTLYNDAFDVGMKNEDVVSYDVNESFPLLAENGIPAFKFFFEDHLKECYIDAKSYPGVKDAVKMLRDNGYVIHIVSFQPSILAKLETLKWLDREGIEYDEITFTNHRDKTSVPCDMIIDDCPDYLNAEPDSVAKVCIDHIYNENTPALHFKSLLEFATLVNDCGLQIRK